MEYADLIMEVLEVTLPIQKGLLARAWISNVRDSSVVAPGAPLGQNDMVLGILF